MNNSHAAKYYIEQEPEEIGYEFGGVFSYVIMWDTFEEVTFEQGKSGGQELPGREKRSCKVVKEEMHLQRKNILVMSGVSKGEN